MKSILIAATIGLSFFVKAQGQLKYSVSIDRNDWRLATVKLEFIPTSDTLYMMEGGTEDLIGGRSAFVKNLTVMTKSGKSIDVVKKDSSSSWAMLNAPRESISASYDMYLDHDKYEWNGGLDGTAYMTDWGIFYACRTLLIFPTGDWTDIQIDFSLPENWKVTTPWEKINEQSFQLTNLSELQNGMFFAGSHEELIFEREGFELIFALGGPSVIGEKEMYEQLAAGVMDYYIDVMGGLPNPSPQNPFKKSVVILNEYDQTDGEVLGNNISILVSKEPDPMSRMFGKFIFAHEFFHLWNGKSIVPENGQECEWFKEGVTNFYTIKSLYHIGQLDQEAYFNLLDQFFYQKYINDPAVGNESITRGDLKHDHWGLVYVGGMLAGMAQDLSIRKQTNNDKSLDDVMRSLFSKLGGTNGTYTLDEIREVSSAISGTDQTDFYNSYVHGTKPIPMENFLQEAGLKVVRKSGHLLIEKLDKSTSQEEKILLGMLGD